MRVSALLLGIVSAVTPLSGQAPVRSYPRSARPPAQWTLEARPILEIGGADATGPAEFSGIVGVVRQGDGTIIVADGASRELRVFDSAGRFRRIAARRGNGPGELPDLDGLASVRDTIIAIENRRAVYAFAPNGDWLRSMQLPPVPGFIVNPVVGALSGTLIAFRLRAGSQESLKVVRHDSTWLASISLRDTSVRIVGAQTLPPTFGVDPRFPNTYPLGFAFQLLAAVNSGRICTSHSARYEIMCIDSVGRHLFSIEREVPVRAVHDSARRAYRAVESGRRPDGTSRFEGTLRAHREKVAAETRFAASFPAVSQLLLSRTGELWVRRFVTEDAIGARGPLGMRWRSNPVPSDWSIYDQQGLWIADCRLPARFAPGEIGADYVIGVTRDADDVERATLFRLRKSPSGRRVP